MFKSIIAAVSAATIALAGSATGVKALSNCAIKNGYEICAVDNGEYAADIITVRTSAGLLIARLEVICTGQGGHRWKGNRNAQLVSYDDMQALSANWCKDY